VGVARHGRREDDRGVAVVEFALVLPVLMVLLLGMVSSATAWNQSQALGHGSRVAARFASTLPLPASDQNLDIWLNDIADRAIAASEGEMANGVGGRSVCVAYVDPAGSAPDRTASRRVEPSGVRTDGIDACFDDGQGDDVVRVQVVLQRTGVIDIGFRRQEIDLRREVVYRYEADGGI
jgi:hypothetical protein